MTNGEFTLDGLNRVKKIWGVGYLSHPYGGSEGNSQKAREAQKMIMSNFPELVLVNGIDNARAFDGHPCIKLANGKHTNWNDTQILQADFRLIKGCDFLILCGEWEKSCGCRAEWAYAVAKGIPVFFAQDEYADEITENPELVLIER